MIFTLPVLANDIFSICFYVFCSVMYILRLIMYRFIFLKKPTFLKISQKRLLSLLCIEYYSIIFILYKITVLLYFRKALFLIKYLLNYHIRNKVKNSSDIYLLCKDHKRFRNNSDSTSCTPSKIINDRN